jgi:phosphoglycerol transferase
MKKINKLWYEFAQYSTTAIITIYITRHVFSLWLVDLQTPILGSGDYYYVLSSYKTLIETGLTFTNPLTGMPFGARLTDFYSGDIFFSFITVIMSTIYKDPAEIHNLIYLGGFPLTALTALYTLKKINIPFYLALPGSISFAFLPFHLLRYAHGLATYFIVPLGLLLFHEAYSGSLSIAKIDTNRKKIHFNLKQPRLWLSVLICIITASSSVYFTFFISAIGVASALRCLFDSKRADRFNRSISCFFLVFVMLVSTLATAAPFLLQSSPVSPFQRYPQESEVYGLKIIQLLLPSVTHRLPQFVQAAQIYNTTSTSVNENYTASLGIIGSLGFLYSLFFLFRVRNENAESVDIYFGFVNVICVFLATVGGFGAVIAYLLLPSIRAYNRISVLIGFVSIASFCLMITRLIEYVASLKFIENQVKHFIIPLGLAVILLVGVFIDQCNYPNFVENYNSLKEVFLSEKRFAKKIEKTMPEGAMIFQLPFMEFPEVVPINNMKSYDPFKPYIHTSGLRWSYGDIKGGKSSEWNKFTALLPIEQGLQRLAAAGFSGIYIDRFGYQDSGNVIESDIRQYVMTPPIVSENTRFVFYDLRSFVKDYRSKFSETEWKDLNARSLKLESVIRPSGKCTGPEGQPGNQWIWCGSNGELVIWNYDSGDRNVILNFGAVTAAGALGMPNSASTARLFAKVGDVQNEFEIGVVSRQFQLTIPMKSNQIVTKVFLESNAVRVDPRNGDLREFVFRLDNPTIGTP